MDRYTKLHNSRKKKLVSLQLFQQEDLPCSMCRFHLQDEIRSWSRSGPEDKQLWETCQKKPEHQNKCFLDTKFQTFEFWHYLDCWPSGRFWVGFIVPADEQATIIFASSLLSLASTPATLSKKEDIQLLNPTPLCKNGPKLMISIQWHTLNKLRILFCAWEDTEESKSKTTSYVPRRPFPYQSVHLHIDSSWRMTLEIQTTHSHEFVIKLRQGITHISESIIILLTALYSASGLTSRITKLFSFCNRRASFTSTLLTYKNSWVKALTFWSTN